MAAWAVNIAAILLALVLLGVEVWVVAIGVLAYVVSRDAITVPVLMRAGTAMVASAIAYCALAILLGTLVPP